MIATVLVVEDEPDIRLGQDTALWRQPRRCHAWRMGVLISSFSTSVFPISMEERCRGPALKRPARRRPQCWSCRRSPAAVAKPGLYTKEANAYFVESFTGALGHYETVRDQTSRLAPLTAPDSAVEPKPECYGRR
jgi:hypothetical protein